MSTTTEKREFRWRSKCPQKVQERLERATTQDFVVLKRKEHTTSSSTKPKCSFIVAGETGNQYKVVIGKIPTCTCPDYKKRSDHCKHTLFVLNKIVGLDDDDELMYQKAYLVDELTSIFECMDDNRHEAADYFFRNGRDEGVDDHDKHDVDGLIDHFGTTTLEDGVAYRNVRGLTGQKSTRDRSTYRPYHRESPPYIRYR
mmetsp:Transcript_35992/g.86640  ORF Transcript_35992/g.86640 Transcript_35992/m.86640 type:complete len:200 (+) Transcript_35992:204-803(+)